MSRPLRVGVQLPEVERVVRWPEYRSMALAAEEVGFDSIWLGDHLLYREPDGPERGPWDAWAMLASLAAVTERVVLGPLVACLAFHPPGLIARMAAAIDEVSGGRFVLGVGSGWNELEYRAFGLPFDHRASRFLESFEIIRRLLAGEHVTSDGRYWQADGAVLLPPPARTIPILLGTSGPRQLAATLPYADGWNSWWASYGNTPEGFSTTSAGITRDRPAGRLRPRCGRPERVRARLARSRGSRPAGRRTAAAHGQRRAHRPHAARLRRGRC